MSDVMGREKVERT